MNDGAADGGFFLLDYRHHKMGPGQKWIQVQTRLTGISRIKAAEARRLGVTKVKAFVILISEWSGRSRRHLR